MLIGRRLAMAGLLAGATLFGMAGARAQTVVKVGSTPSGVPFTFLDTKTNTIQGVMVDLIKAIGEKEGFKPEITSIQFSSLIAALNANKIDVISAAMFITPPRQKVVDFSEPVYTYGEGLIVPSSDKKEYHTLQDLKGYTIGVEAGTAFVDYMQKSGLFREVKIYDSIPDIMRDVNVGRLQAGFADLPIVAYNMKLGGYPQLRLVKEYKPSVVGSVGIGVRKNKPDLLKKINDGLAALKQDGTLHTILAKWGIEE